MTFNIIPNQFISPYTIKLLNRDKLILKIFEKIYRLPVTGYRLSITGLNSYFAKNFCFTPSMSVDEKLKIYKSLQSEIQTLYGKKQQSLSQLNENVLVKGVR
jgi:hypothetical protein